MNIWHIFQSLTFPNFFTVTIPILLGVVGLKSNPLWFHTERLRSGELRINAWTTLSEIFFWHWPVIHQSSCKSSKEKGSKVARLNMSIFETDSQKFFGSRQEKKRVNASFKTRIGWKTGWSNYNMLSWQHIKCMASSTQELVGIHKLRQSQKS